MRLPVVYVIYVRVVVLFCLISLSEVSLCTISLLVLHLLLPYHILSRSFRYYVRSLVGCCAICSLLSFPVVEFAELLVMVCLAHTLGAFHFPAYMMCSVSVANLGICSVKFSNTLSLWYLKRVHLFFDVMEACMHMYEISGHRRTLLFPYVDEPTGGMLQLPTYRSLFFSRLKLSGWTRECVIRLEGSMNV